MTVVVAGSFGAVTSVRVRRAANGGGGGGVLASGGGTIGTGGGIERACVRGCARITGPGNGGVRVREIAGGIEAGIFTVAVRGVGGGAATTGAAAGATSFVDVSGGGDTEAICSVAGVTAAICWVDSGSSGGGATASICFEKPGGADTANISSVVRPGGTPPGGVIVDTLRVGIVVTPRGGVVVETVRGGIVDTPRGGVRATGRRAAGVAPSGDTIFVIGEPGLVGACGSFIPCGMPRIVGTFIGASCAPIGGIVTRPVWRADSTYGSTLVSAVGAPDDSPPLPAASSRSSSGDRVIAIRCTRPCR
jgi:hypothetical protein